MTRFGIPDPPTTLGQCTCGDLAAMTGYIPERGDFLVVTRGDEAVRLGVFFVHVHRPDGTRLRLEVPEDKVTRRRD